MWGDKGLIDELIEKLQHALAQGWNSLTSPLFDWLYLAEWWMAAVGILVLCTAVSFFLPFTWVRVISGWVVSLALTAAVVATVVFKHLKPTKRR